MATKKTADSKAANTETASREILRKIWWVGLGAVAAGEEGAVKLYDYLLEKGKEFENRHKDSFDGMRDKAREASRDVKERVGKGLHQVGNKVDTKVSSAMSRVGVGNKEIGALKERVDELAAKVDELKPELAN